MTTLNLGKTDQVKEIHLALGRGVAIVDSSNYEDLARFKWRLTNTGYAIRKWQINHKVFREYMHRRIMKATKGQQVDHINGNSLDNRKANLRLCTTAQNARNQKPHRNKQVPLKGVSRHRPGKFTACICVNRRRIYLGIFDTPEDASKAYNAAAIKYHGEFARVNP